MRRSLALIAVPALALVFPLMADHREREKNWDPQFRGLDRNNDGAVSRSEWRGSRDSFDGHDWNRDGFISGDELTGREHQSSRDARTSADDNRPQHFRQLDTNNDGVLSSTEWKGEKQVFHLLDRDFNSRLSYNEFLDRNPNVFLKDLDRNRDGRISRSEWRGTAAAFRDLDYDHNGYLDSEEFFYRGTAAERQRRFARLDDNKNGVIDGFEWHGDRNLFHAMDRNRNSVLDYNEFTQDTTVGSADRIADDDQFGDDDDSFFEWPY